MKASIKERTLTDGSLVYSVVLGDTFGRVELHTTNRVSAEKLLYAIDNDVVDFDVDAYGMVEGG